MDMLRDPNRYYDNLPEFWRFPMVLGLLVLVGAINMALTIGTGFPFGLLVLLTIFILAAIRLPYALYAGHEAAANPPPTTAHSNWSHDWNGWYESIPELWRFLVVVGVLVLVGALNMALTIAAGFPFGLLVLLAIIAIAAIRLSHTRGSRRAARAPQPATFEPGAGAPARAIESPPPPLASVPNHAPLESAPAPIPPQEAALPPAVEAPTPASTPASTPPPAA